MTVRDRAVDIRHRRLTTNDGEYGRAEVRDWHYASELRSKLMLVSADSAAVPSTVGAPRRVDTVHCFVELLNAAEAIIGELEKLQRAGCLSHRAEPLVFTFREPACVHDARLKRQELSASYGRWLQVISQLPAVPFPQTVLAHGQKQTI